VSISLSSAPLSSERFVRMSPESEPTRVPLVADSPSNAHTPIVPRRLDVMLESALNAESAEFDLADGDPDHRVAELTAVMETTETVPVEAELESDQIWYPVTSPHEFETIETEASHLMHQLPEPPVSASWDWPLSRQERKARVQLLDRQLMLAEQQDLMWQLEELRQDDGTDSSKCGRRRHTLCTQFD
jgi:hypothetical protein